MGKQVGLAKKAICMTAIALAVDCGMMASSTITTAFANTTVTSADQNVLAESINKAVAAIHTKQSAQQFRNTIDWTLLALKAADVDGTSSNWRNSSGLSGIDQLEKGIETVNKQPISFATTDFERVLLGVLAGSKDPKAYAHRDWIRVIEDSIRPDGKFADTADGAGTDLVNAQIWGVISLYAAGVTFDQAMNTEFVNWLDHAQHPDGGWDWTVQDSTSDTDITAMALVAYHALQVPNSDIHVQKALQLLHARQNESGGFLGADGTASTETTAAAIEALLAQGIDPASWKQGSNDPVQSLLKAQLADGSFVHQLSSDSGITQSGNDMATAQALIALADLKHGDTVYDRLRETSITRQNEWVPYSDDVQPSSSYFAAIRRLQGMGVINGYGDGTFRPDNSITRAEFASMLVHALNDQDQIGPKTTQFRDVAASSWYNPVIKVAYENNLITGVAPGLFAPLRQVTGAEVMTMLVRAMGLGQLAQAQAQANPGQWYTGYVQVAKQNDLLYPDFSADKPATRAQCAAAIQQYYQWLAKR
jgi:S-layer homology domain